MQRVAGLAHWYYTSYPTAQQFHPGITSSGYADWLSKLKPGSHLSLYCHIPFCQSLCWYCGCTTKALRRYDPVATYLDAITAEIANVAARVTPDHQVTHIHWGGGTPNILQATDIEKLSDTLRAHYKVAPDAEFAVEIDPRHLDPEQVAAFERSGVNRVSIGVQDFDPAVQKAINRIQSFDMTERAITMFRASGINSINADLVYGLPNQTSDSIARTIEQVLSLRPDRIATFGYAHLPRRLIHQRLIDESGLPGPVERFAQSQLLARLLMAAGYVRIGLDHFALRSDHLTGTALKRNFQGYSTEQADALALARPPSANCLRATCRTPWRRVNTFQKSGVEFGADGAHKRAAGIGDGIAIGGAFEEVAGLACQDAVGGLQDGCGFVGEALKQFGGIERKAAHQLFDDIGAGAVVIGEGNATDGCEARLPLLRTDRCAPRDGGLTGLARKD